MRTGITRVIILAAWALPFQAGADGIGAAWGIVCAPDSVSNNIAITEELLQTYANQHPGQEHMKATLEGIKSQSSEVKVNAYFKLVGVDSNSKSDVLNFISARDSSKYAAQLQGNLNLPASDAAYLTENIRKTLRGQIVTK